MLRVCKSLPRGRPLNRFSAGKKPGASLDFALEKCEHFNPLIEITRT
jgi:hypothetical protein